MTRLVRISSMLSPLASQPAERWLNVTIALVAVTYLGGCAEKEDVAALQPAPVMHDAKAVPAAVEIDELADAAAKHFRARDFVERDDGELRLDIRDEFLFVEGTINSATHDDIKRLLDAHPDVQTLVFTNVPGSMDDEVNLEAGRLIRARGLTTYLPAKGSVASGGTDLFLAGSKRIVERGAQIGVHSWGTMEGGIFGLFGATIVEGRDVPKDSPEHRRYLGYYRDLSIPERFYWYTLEAASLEDIHWMRKEEMADYGIYTHWREGRIREAAATKADQPAPTNPNYVIYPGPELIQRDVAAFNPDVARFYDRLIAFETPDGSMVPLLAQDEVTDEQLLRAYNILDSYLTDVPGTAFGADKAAVANAMAANGAVLILPNGEDDGSNAPEDEAAAIGQPLFANEFPIEGSTAYMENDFEQRDAGFEEILHLVHDYGIGTVYTDGALKPEYQEEIYAVAFAALNEGRWAITEESVERVEELKEEGSIEQEYLASVIDSYYGLWGAWDEAPGGMWGEYVAKTRDEIAKLDPAGLGVVEKFFDLHLRYMARIDPAFEGTFSMTFDPAKPYTHKSRYLTNARLLGKKSSNLIGNDQDNVLMGNRGDNVIDGRRGKDVVQFQGASTDYEIRMESGKLVVVDSRDDRDGKTTLRNIDILRFTDIDIPAR